MKVRGPIHPDPTLLGVSEWPFEFIANVDVVHCGELDADGKTDHAYAHLELKNGLFGPSVEIRRDVLENSTVGVWDFTEKRLFRVFVEPVAGEYAVIGSASGAKKLQTYRAVKIIPL